jgi:hypothetical protein
MKSIISDRLSKSSFAYDWSDSGTRRNSGLIRVDNSWTCNLHQCAILRLNHRRGEAVDDIVMSNTRFDSSDLNKIPYYTNVTGQMVTGVAPPRYLRRLLDFGNRCAVQKADQVILSTR